ncbi:MAG: hypothetical protein JL50_19675 [Peptococcaceae bacterium BICA1-7]|nr:MAG: hypothetical protein JL50_19675 [Peptococcaceae bacterium BICA1-7]HBV98297.1 acid-soluble spore protein [Desulfotomaculum sp.]
MENNYLTVIHTEIPDLVQNISNGLVPAELKPFIGPALEEFRNEIATELGLPDYAGMDKGELPSRLNGKVGGNMVGKMVAFTETVLAYHYRQRLAAQGENKQIGPVEERERSDF